MEQSTMTYVAMDTHKNTISIAIAEGGRRGEVRFAGEIPSRPEAVGKMVDRLAAKHGRLAFCYEAGPCGYGLYRQITMLGHECVVRAFARSDPARRPRQDRPPRRRDDGVAVSLGRIDSGLGSRGRA